MTSRRFVCSGLSVVLLVITAPLILPAQSSSQANDEIKSEIAKLYSDVHPYMNEPVSELKKTIRELSGLKPATDAEMPPDLLSKIGNKADELLHKVPDLISDESVSQTQRSGMEGMIPGCQGMDCLPAGRMSVKDQTFHYLILSDPAPNGQTVLKEYRTKDNGKQVEGSGSPAFQGFVGAWVIFSSANQVESRFRYLGEQQTAGHKTFVVGFAQKPESVMMPGIIRSGSQSIPMFLQGIAWIDQSDFSIVRLRTDLLAPLPEISTQRQTASILFGAVQIASLNLTLWLPQSVNAEMEAGGQVIEERHKYSKYRLYQTKSTIVAVPE